MRYRVVMEWFRDHIKENCIDTTMDLLRGKYGFMCQYDSEPDFETVWSSLFDLRGLAVYRAEGDPRKKEFLLDGRLQDG